MSMPITKRAAKKVALALVAKIAGEFEISGMFEGDNGPSQDDLCRLESAKRELVIELMRRAGLHELPHEPAEYLALAQN